MLPYSSVERPMPPALNYQPPEKPPHKRPAVIIGVILGAIALAGMVFAAYYLFFRKPLPNVSIQVSKPDQVLVGEPFKLTVAYTNSSEETLKDAVVAVTVPEGIAIIGVDPSNRLGQQTAGDLGPQSLGNKTFDLVATDGENSVKHISIALRYRLKDGGATLERTADAEISVGAPAVGLNFDVPQNVFAGQVFDISVSYQNNSQASFPNAKLVFDYPPSFEVDASSSSTASGNEWDLGTISPGSQGTVTVTGKVAAGQQSFLAMDVHLQVDIAGQRYDLGARPATIGIQSTPLSLAIAVNRKSNYTASLGDKLTYILSYHNGSQFALQDVVIKAALEGEMFDISTLKSLASLDSVKNTLTWNAATSPALESLAPGQSGSVEFTISLQKSWPIQNESDKDFVVVVNGGIQSLSVPAGITAEQTASNADSITKIAGRASVASLAYYFEPTGAVQNTGPYPPRVNQPTQYTVHWQIRNSSTDLKDVEVSALLQSGAKLVKVVKSTAATSPVYDARTGQVTWDIPAIGATKGLLGDPVEAIFQIEATPAVNQVGRDIPLISATTLTATDAFTGTVLKASAGAKSSSLPDDGQIPDNNSKVQP